MRDVHDNLDGIESLKDSKNVMETHVYARNDSAGSEFQLPENMVFNSGHLLSIIVYTCLFVFSSIANITVLVLLLKRKRKNSSRLYTMLIHLAIADLLVTFLMMPLEIGWSATVMWVAGDALCRVMSFFRTFGLYLSSFVLVCISIDRYYAVLKPLHVAGSKRRCNISLMVAWMGATLCSIPQAIVFHVETHPEATWYTQCVVYNFFPSHTYEILYSVSGMLMMYAFPLTIIIYCYVAILLEISRRTKFSNDEDNTITRGSLPFFNKAKIRTLKLTVIIVCAFFVCWTPYYIMCLWYWIDSESAEKVDERVQKCLFLFACTNSCMNPVVYGAFNIRALQKAVRRDMRPRTFTFSSNNTVNTPPCESRLRQQSFERKTTSLYLL